MKKVFLLCILVGLITTMEAKEKKEPVVMTVAGKDIPLSEFIFMAKKDNSVDFRNKQSVKNYVELYKNFKLKVADAEALTIHEAPRFEEEMEKLGLQLQQSYLTDKSGEDSVIRIMYERTKNIPVTKQIFFRYPQEMFELQRIYSTDTLALFEKVNDAYTRIQNGESFEAVGKALSNGSDIYFFEKYVYPFMYSFKVVEDYIYSMRPGDISGPVRCGTGFYLLKVDSIIPNPGTIRVVHILSAYPSENPTDEEIAETRRKSEEIYQKALSNEDFTALAIAFSDDSVNARNGGIIEFRLGELLNPFEKAGFALANIGDISQPFQSRYGYHILKLTGRKPISSFEDDASYIYNMMQKSDRFFDLNRSFDERIKTRHGFVFHAEAYEELQRLANENFPTDSIFISRGLDMEKTLISIDTLEFSQSLFVEYLQNRNPLSSQIHVSSPTYSLDLMQEVFDYFIRDILTEVEKRSLVRDYPDYLLQLNEYYDATLLFEISNKRVWSRAVEEQEQLEAEWVKELNEKYPVTINWKVIKKIKKI